jgi:NAD(P)-dependent dehydrogenase (short-subunit alcohol dehydrogenase family)
VEFRVTGLEGKVVVITGGARGMGAAYVRGFLAEDAKVVAADLSWNGVEAFRAEVEAAGGLPLVMDVTDNRAIEAAYTAVIERFGTVDVLVNNAGMRQRDLYPPHGRVTTLETSDADWERMFAVNVFGVLKVTRRFIQPMLERRRGSIINACSSGILAHSHGGAYTALRPNSREMPYMASKAALATMCFYLADEVKAQNVAVNLILPGHTRTTGSAEQARLRAAMGATNAAKMLVPEHVVPLVLYLATQDASQVTGKLFDVVQWNLEHGLGGRERWEVPE